MKITESQLKQYVKQVVKEISSKQRAHDARLAGQMDERAAKEAERDELRQILWQAVGQDWEVNVRMLEGRYQLTVHKAYTGEDKYALAESKYKVRDTVRHDREDLGTGTVVGVEPGKEGNVLVRWESGTKRHHRWELRPAKKE